MKIICAGFSKTGTTSMAAALRILGLTVYDYEEHLQYHMEEYIQAYKGNMPDFIAMYKNVDAITDYPACFFWEEIKESFPDAKVILMERDNIETWVKSMLDFEDVWNSSVFPKIWFRVGLLMTPTGRKWKEMDADFEDFYKPDAEEKVEEKLSRLYTDHNARVKAAIPRDELLVYNVKQGWKPLCEFLGVEVPDVPFPRLNVKGDVTPHVINNSVIGRRVFNEVVILLTILVIAIAILIFLMIN